MQQTFIKMDPKHQIGCKYTDCICTIALLWLKLKKYFILKRAVTEDTEIF